MWTLIWDTIGYFMDNVPRWAKITLLAVLTLAIYFFFGYRVTIYAIGGIFWFMFIFLVIAHIVVVRRNLKKQKEAPPPLTPADQADIVEFQEAMLQEVGPESPMQTVGEDTTKTPVKKDKGQDLSDPNQAGSSSSSVNNNQNQDSDGTPPTDLPLA